MYSPNFKHIDFPIRRQHVYPIAIVVASDYTNSKNAYSYRVSLVHIFPLQIVFAASICYINFVYQFEQVQIVGALVTYKYQREIFHELQKQIARIVSHMKY